MLTLPPHLAFSSFLLLTLEIAIEATVLQLKAGQRKSLQFSWCSSHPERAPGWLSPPVLGCSRGREALSCSEGRGGRADRAVDLLAGPLCHSTEKGWAGHISWQSPRPDAAQWLQTCPKQWDRSEVKPRGQSTGQGQQCSSGGDQGQVSEPKHSSWANRLRPQ